MLTTLLALAIAAPDPAPIQTIVEQARQSWGVPGVAVAVVKGDEILYLQGHGTIGLGLPQPVTAQTLFPISSCTKGFTTALLGQLVEQGKMDWDDPVRRHVPQFRLSDPLADAEVTLRDLLCHRTGVGTHPWLWFRAPWTRADLIRRIGLVPLSKPFRTAFQYQNTMFVVAGQAAENVAGQPWERQLQERLLTPLGMTQTFTHAVNVPVTRMARGHRPGANGLEMVPLYLTEKPDPAVSMVSNASDLARWLRFHLRGGSVDGKPLVKSSTLETMRTPQICLPLEGVDRELHPDTVQMAYGMAWVLQDYRGRPLASHAGVHYGFRVHLTLAPRDGIGIAILANHEQTRMHLALSNSLLDLLLGLEKRDWNAVMQQALIRAEQRAQRENPPPVLQPGTRTTHPLADYVGNYENAAYGTIQVRQVGLSLRWTYNRFTGPLTHLHLDTFRLKESTLDDPLLTFHLDVTGAVDRLEMLGSFQTTFRRVRE